MVDTYSVRRQTRDRHDKHKRQKVNRSSSTSGLQEARSRHKIVKGEDGPEEETQCKLVGLVRR
jgi:hypothetical protein